MAGGEAAARQGRAAVAGSVEIRGLACPFCARGLQTKIGALPWVEDVAVYVDDGRADFTVAPGRIPDVAALREAVRKAGFTSGEVTLRAVGRIQRSGREAFLVVGPGRRLALAGSGACDRLRGAEDRPDRTVEVEGAIGTEGERTVLEVRSCRLP